MFINFTWKYKLLYVKNKTSKFCMQIFLYVIIICVSKFNAWNHVWGTAPFYFQKYLMCLLFQESKVIKTSHQSKYLEQISSDDVDQWRLVKQWVTRQCNWSDFYFNCFLLIFICSWQKTQFLVNLPVDINSFQLQITDKWKKFFIIFNFYGCLPIKYQSKKKTFKSQKI